MKHTKKIDPIFFVKTFKGGNLKFKIKAGNYNLRLPCQLRFTVARILKPETEISETQKIQQTIFSSKRSRDRILNFKRKAGNLRN